MSRRKSRIDVGLRHEPAHADPRRTAAAPLPSRWQWLLAQRRYRPRIIGHVVRRRSLLRRAARSVIEHHAACFPAKLELPQREVMPDEAALVREREDEPHRLACAQVIGWNRQEDPAIQRAHARCILTASNSKTAAHDCGPLYVGRQGHRLMW